MKKNQSQKLLIIPVLLLGLLFFPTSMFGQTSTYHTFPDSAVRWNFYSYFQCAGGIRTLEYSIEMTKDTVINSRNYHKLEVAYVKTFIGGHCNTGHYYPGYKGAIREDSALRKVYIVPVDSSNEILLYDFNLTVGDTVRGYLTSGISNLDSNAVVQSIDSVLVDSVYHKRWKIGLIHGVYLIEGIGFTYFLINHLLFRPGNNYPPYLTCVSIQNTCVYPDSVKTCGTITSLEKTKYINKELNLYPNPFQNSFSFKSGKVIHQLQIYNISGQQIQSTIVDAKSYSWAPAIEAGIYFVKITDRLGNSSMKKLIKTK